MGGRGTILAVAAATLALAGCGGGDKSNRDTTSRPPATTTAQDAEAKAQARELVTGVEACFVDQQDYSTCKEPQGVSVPLGSGPGQAQVSDAGPTGYTVVAHSKSGTSFEVKKDQGGAIARSCDKPGDGGCPEGGKW